VEIKEEETFFENKTITNKIQEYSYDTSGQLIRIETYVNDFTKSLIEIQNKGNYYTETIKFSEMDTIGYEKTVTDSNGKAIEHIVKRWRKDESGINLEEYYISTTQYDDTLGREIKAVIVDLKEKTTTNYEYKYKQLPDTLVKTIWRDKILDCIIKTCSDNNAKHELMFDGNNTLISQSTAWLNGNNPYLETSSQKSGEGTYMSDSIFYENGKIVRIIMKDSPIIFQDSYKYDDNGNITEKMNVMYEEQNNKL
jgi:hypothetical protein